MRRPKPLIRLILEPLGVAVVLAFLVRAGVRIYSIPSSSMAPTLQPGDRILVTLFGEPKRGDVIVFRGPDGQMLVKRVIAVPGDLIDARQGYVRIAGKSIAEPYLLRQAASGDIAAQIVPGSSYFVMGDNRTDSHDSRSWGAVHRSLVVGRARMVLWSSHADASAESAARASTVSRIVPAVAPLHVERIFKCIH